VTAHHDIRRQLAELHGMATQARENDRNLVAAAAGRLAWVQARIEEIRPRIFTSPELNAEYLELVEERGWLDSLLTDSRLTRAQTPKRAAHSSSGITHSADMTGTWPNRCD
jgi:hypothetical protein